MRIVFLGTGGYHPNARRHTAGLFVPELGLLLDAGTGSFRVTNFLSTRTLRVFLSHAHLDHVCGLTYLVVPVVRQQITNLQIFGTQKTIDAVETHLFSEAIFPVLPDCEFHLLSEDSCVDLGGGASLSCHPLTSHPGGSMAFRVDIKGKEGPPKSFAYVTDTAVDGSYTDFINGVDLLIHECYFPDEMADWAVKTGHACVSEVACLATEAGAGRLLLTHIDPEQGGDDPVGLVRAREIFANTQLAEDLMEVSL